MIFLSLYFINSNALWYRYYSILWTVRNLSFNPYTTRNIKATKVQLNIKINTLIQWMCLLCWKFFMSGVIFISLSLRSHSKFILHLHLDSMVTTEKKTQPHKGMSQQMASENELFCLQVWIHDISLNPKLSYRMHFQFWV
jgi:hypothetical protein